MDGDATADDVVAAVADVAGAALDEVAVVAALATDELADEAATLVAGALEADVVVDAALPPPQALSTKPATPPMPVIAAPRSVARRDQTCAAIGFLPRFAPRGRPESILASGRQFCPAGWPLGVSWNVPHAILRQGSAPVKPLEESPLLPRRPTIFDVAREAGVSKSTVSKVLTNAPYIRAETRTRVEAAVALLNFQPNVAARRFQSRQSRLVGLVLPNVGEASTPPAFFTAFMRGAGKAAADHHYDLIWLVSISRQVGAAEDYAQTYLRREVDAMVLTNVPLGDPRVAALKQTGCPFVVVGRYDDPDVHTVDVDNLAIGYLATQHLLRLGHRRVALLNGRPHHPFCQDRLAGYTKALSEYGLALDDSLINWLSFREQDGYDATLHLLRGESPPTALIVTDAGLREGCRRALEELRVNTKSPVSVVGVDDFPPLPGRPITTVVVQPTAELGVAAVELVLQLIAGPPPPTRQQVLSPMLIEGRGSAPPLPNVG